MKFMKVKPLEGVEFVINTDYIQSITPRTAKTCNVWMYDIESPYVINMSQDEMFKFLNEVMYG